MKWLILIVVVILAAPTVANRLTPGGDNKAAARGRDGGLLYRAVRRFGPRAVLAAAVLALLALAVLAILLVRAL